MMSSRQKILILDDEFIVGLALADELEMSGFEVMGPFGNAQEATEAMEAGMPDAAFLDVNLGDGSTSHDIATSLLDKAVPVAFLTGYSEVGAEDPRLSEVPCLAKPVQPERVVAEAKRLLFAER